MDLVVETHSDEAPVRDSDVRFIVTFNSNTIWNLIFDYALPLSHYCERLEESPQVRIFRCIT